MKEYWGMSLDELNEQLWYELQSDAIGAHYVTFEGDKITARQKMIGLFTAYIDKHLYRANSYGSEWQEGDEDEDEN